MKKAIGCGLGIAALCSFVAAPIASPTQDPLTVAAFFIEFLVFFGVLNTFFLAWAHTKWRFVIALAMDSLMLGAHCALWSL